MSPQRIKLLLLQALVAVLVIGFWHVGSTVPVGGGYLLPKFFFSTPADVGLRVWKLFAEGTAQIVRCSEPIDLSHLLSTSDPCFGKTVWQHLLITATEGMLAFVIGAVAGVALGFWLARNRMLSAVFEPYIKMLNALPRVVPGADLHALAGSRHLVQGGAGRDARVLYRVFQRLSGREGSERGDPRQRAHARHERAPAVCARLLAFGPVVDVFLAAHLRGICHHRRRGGRVPGLGRGPGLSHQSGRGNVRYDGRVCRYGHSCRIRARHRRARHAG